MIVAVLIAPWIWIAAFTFTFGWAIDDIKSRHEHLRDMAIGAVIHYIGFVIVSLPILYFVAGAIFGPIVTYRYFRHGLSAIPISGLAIGLGLVAGNVAAKSMNAPAGADFDAIVRAFLHASLAFAAAFFLMSHPLFASLMRQTLNYAKTQWSRFNSGITMSCTEGPHDTFTNGNHTGGPR